MNIELIAKTVLEALIRKKPSKAEYKLADCLFPNLAIAGNLNRLLDL